MGDVSERVASVVRDARLTPDAVRIILDVAVRGGGQHEISHTHFSILLNHSGGRKRISRALSLATDLGWLERTPGGRGHSDQYAFRCAENGGAKTDLGGSETGGLSLGGRQMGGLSGDRVPSNRPPKARARGGSSREVDVEEEEEGARASARLHPKADGLLKGDDLRGCRGALGDYLRARVEPPRQYAYLQTVRTWLGGTIQGSVFKNRSTGSTAPKEQWTNIIAEAANDLAQSDEEKMSRAVGDVGNLRTKISIIVQQRGDRERPTASTNGRRDPGSSRPEPQGRRRKRIPVEGIDD